VLTFEDLLRQLEDARPDVTVLVEPHRPGRMLILNQAGL
jgi:hypothetical protein